jgi:DNA-binding NarL/FixJ family response regulator
MRAGLKVLLERQPGFKVVGEAADGRQTVVSVLATSPM